MRLRKKIYLGGYSRINATPLSLFHCEYQEEIKFLLGKTRLLNVSIRVSLVDNDI